MPRFAPFLLVVFAAEAICLLAPSEATARSKLSKSDTDISQIGHRNVGLGANLYSLEKEAAVGKVLAQEVDRSSRLITDPLETDYLNQLARKIAQHSDARLPITIKVIDSSETNACTLLGGIQYVNTTLLLEAETEAELAGVLSYGIAHTALRTWTKKLFIDDIVRLPSVPSMIFPSCVAPFPTHGPATESIRA